MSKTKERRKSIQRQIGELADNDRVPAVARQHELALVARSLQEAWRRLTGETTGEPCGVWREEEAVA